MHYFYIRNISLITQIFTFSLSKCTSFSPVRISMPPAITNQVIAISTIEIYINVSLYPLCKCCIKKPLFGYLYYLCIQHTWKFYPLISSVRFLLIIPPLSVPTHPHFHRLIGHLGALCLIGLEVVMLWITIWIWQ